MKKHQVAGFMANLNMLMGLCFTIAENPYACLFVILAFFYLFVMFKLED